MLSVGESKRSESGKKLSQGTTVFLWAWSWYQEPQKAALDMEVRAWNWLVRLIECSVLPYAAARLTPGVGRVLAHLWQSHSAEHPSDQMPSPLALLVASVYLMIPGHGCKQ